MIYSGDTDLWHNHFTFVQIVKIYFPDNNNLLVICKLRSGTISSISLRLLSSSTRMTFTWTAALTSARTRAEASHKKKRPTMVDLPGACPSLGRDMEAWPRRKWWSLQSGCLQPGRRSLAAFRLPLSDWLALCINHTPPMVPPLVDRPAWFVASELLIDRTRPLARKGTDRDKS